jgi:hypothetical protein
MTVPYTPTPFAVPIVNPSIGATGVPYPYISNSEYLYAPTAMDTSNLVQNGSVQDQSQSLADTIRRASRWADRYVMGADPASKGASLCATINTENTYTNMVNGWLRLVCAYKPIVQVNGIDVGPTPGNTSSIGQGTANLTRIGARTIFVPINYGQIANPPNGDISPLLPSSAPYGSMYCVWSYVNGYPHTFLMDGITSGTNTCTVATTDGVGGLLGFVPNTTVISVVDGAKTESLVVKSVSGTTITTVTNFQFSHTVPTGPDFIPVTSLPDDISLATIFLTTSLIKTRGDNSLILDEMQEPDRFRAAAGDVMEDVAYALSLLDAYRVRTKVKG